MDHRTIFEHERDFARATVQALKELGLTEKDVAARMKMKLPTFATILRGEKGRNIPIQTFNDLYDVLLNEISSSAPALRAVTLSQYIAILKATAVLADLLKAWKLDNKARSDEGTYQRLVQLVEKLATYLSANYEYNSMIYTLTQRFPEKCKTASRIERQA